MPYLRDAVVQLQSSSAVDETPRMEMKQEYWEIKKITRQNSEGCSRWRSRDHHDDPGGSLLLQKFSNGEPT